MKQTKKWLAGLLCAVLLVGLLPAAAFAAEGTGTTGKAPTATAREGGAGAAEGGVALTKEGGELTTGDYVLNSDVTLTHNLTISGTVTLDLRGHTLIGSSGADSEGGAPVITVSDGGTLTLKDTGGNGTVTGGNTPNTTENSDAWLYGGGVTVNSGGTFYLEGGSITGNKNGELNQAAAGGVCVNGGGAFHMSGGSITGNTGAGLSVGTDHASCTGATATISGGTISNNMVGNGQTYGTKSGGGVYVTRGSTCTMTGGTISGNTAEEGGGGVFIYGGTFKMSGGSITGNRASFGGGVVVSAHEVNAESNYEGAGKFIMTGGTITGNTATDYGGGVVLAQIEERTTTFEVSGTPKITGNTVNDAANNAWLTYGRTVTATGALSAGAGIGVTLGDAGALNLVDKVTICNGTTDASYFSSDSTDWNVTADTSSVALEKVSKTNGLSRAQLALMLQQHESFGWTNETGSGASAFNDVGDCTREEQNAIGVLFTKQVLTGTADGKFNPGSAVTRGEAAVFIYRAAGSPTNGAIEVPTFRIALRRVPGVVELRALWHRNRQRRNRGCGAVSGGQRGRPALLELVWIQPSGGLVCYHATADGTTCSTFLFTFLPCLHEEVIST